MILIIWAIACAVAAGGWFYLLEELSYRQSWFRRASLVVGWACLSFVVGAGVPL